MEVVDKGRLMAALKYSVSYNQQIFMLPKSLFQNMDFPEYLKLSKLLL